VKDLSITPVGFPGVPGLSAFQTCFFVKVPSRWGPMVNIDVWGHPPVFYRGFPPFDNQEVDDNN